MESQTVGDHQLDNNNNNNNTASTQQIYEGVARTSLFVAAGRAYATNRYFRNLIDKPSTERTPEEEDIIREFQPFYERNLSDEFIPASAAIYDPYSYHFSITKDAIRLIHNTIKKVDPTYPVEEIELYHPMYLWKFIKDSAHQRIAFRTKYIDYFIESHYNENIKNNNIVIHDDLTTEENINSNSSSLIKNVEYKQIIILGAGLDTRGLRLKLPSDSVVFELDLPEVIEYKNQLIDAANQMLKSRSNCRVVRLATDLLHSENWTRQLIEAGYRTDVESLWVSEGLLMYFNESEIKRLLNTINGISKVGSKVLIHTTNITPEEKRTMIYQEFKSMTDHPEKYLEETGFSHDIHTVSYIGINRRFGSPDVNISKSSQFTNGTKL